MNHNTKILYLHRTDIPDNHVPPTFLASLQRNVNVVRPRLSHLVASSAALSCQVSAVFLFVAVFLQLYNLLIDPAVVIIVATATSIFFLFIWMQLGLLHDITDVLRRSGLFVLVLFGVTPILQTLATDISSDTIWALATMLFIGHIAFCDYSTSDTDVAIRFPATLSTNFALLASAHLSSRLVTHVHAFALLATCILLFSLFPLLRRNLGVVVKKKKKKKKKNNNINMLFQCCDVGGLRASSLILNVGMAAAGVPLVWPFSRAAVAGYLIAQMLITVLGSVFFRYAHDAFKNTLHGPWDRALPSTDVYSSSTNSSNSGGGGN